jgi:hypothetical protein
MSTSPASSAPQPAPAPSQRKEQKPPFQLTPEQLAKQAERKALKALKVKADGEKPLRSKEQLAKGEFKRREWITVNESGEVGEGTKVKVMSWNVSLHVASSCSCSWVQEQQAELLTLKPKR